MRGGEEVGRGGDLVDEPGRLRLVGVVGGGAQHHRPRLRLADRASEALGAARARRDRGRDLDEADASVAPRHDAQVAGEGDLAAAREGVAVDGGDDHLGQRAEPVERGVGAGELGDTGGRGGEQRVAQPVAPGEGGDAGEREAGEGVGHRVGRAPRLPRRSRRGGSAGRRRPAPGR